VGSAATKSSGISILLIRCYGEREDDSIQLFYEEEERVRSARDDSGLRPECIGGYKLRAYRTQA
jgi:hypothetical protein